MPEPTKRALLIGIGKYLEPIRPLTGCVNDAELLASILGEQFGFTDITLLRDAEGTRAGILAAMDALLKRTDRDDVVVFFFAGHGSQRPDQEGDEPSGFDSTLLAVDATHDGTEFHGDITDDEIALWLQDLGEKTSAITVIVDACHSGTITRDVDDIADGFQTRGVPPSTTKPTMASRIPEAQWPRLTGRTATGAPVAGGWLPPKDHYTLLSACRDEQKAGEFTFTMPDKTDKRHGAMTFYLAAVLRQVGPTDTYRSVYERVAAAVVSVRGTRQHPQIEGKIDRVLFGLRELPPMRYLRIASVTDDGSAFTLAGGAAQGLQVGTTLAVYPAGTLVTAESAPLATARIDAVTAVTASARITSSPPTKPLEADARVVVTGRPLDSTRRPVRISVTEGEVPPSALDALRTAIGASPVLDLVENATADTLIVRAWPAGGSRTGPSWAIVGGDGLPMAPLKPLDDVASTVANLETRARYALALALRNENELSPLRRAAFNAQLLLERPDGSWDVAPPGPGGLPVVTHGSRVGIRITNPTSRPLYLSVVSFGLLGTITPVYPGPAQEALKPGITFNAMTIPGQRVSYEVPDVYPFAPDGDLPVLHDGIETLKVFLTTSPANFEFLEQVGVRDSQSVSAIQRLFERAVPTTRESRRESDAALGVGDDWATIELPFLLTRAATGG
ncbi:MAG: caspase family protein [Gemmatimonadaceae bacterium]|nr:caspase family protein [Gemmatimonadaceae bacterium]